MTTLLFFTGSYPYSVAAEDTFIPQELAVLSSHFDEIVVVPGSTEGSREPIELPNVTVDTGFAIYAASRRRKWRHLLIGPFDPEFLRELISRFPLLARHRSALRKAVGHYVQSRMAESWVRSLEVRNESGSIVACSWWFDSATLGLARFGRQANVPVVTRAHGYDVYESRHTPPYIPFRQSTLDKIDRVYADSDAGAQYLAARYPSAAHKIRTGLLGIEDPGVLCAPSSDGVWRMVSCSFLAPVKRIDLFIRGLAKLGEDEPDVCVDWTHIGDGPEKARLRALAEASLPRNVRWQLKEYPGKRGLNDFYRTQPVDLFINVSASEGTPVALMEAISVGLPVLCTAVGGNIEVVGNQNGLLLSANPSPDEISEGIKSLMGHPEELPGLRAASRAQWERRYNAATNYAVFANELSLLRKLPVVSERVSRE